jgi:hypothetical protein
MEIPEHWIKSYIRNKKIDKLIEKRSWNIKDRNYSTWYKRR